MDPLTEIRHGPRVRKIPLNERQFITHTQMRRQLEVYSGVARKSHHGTWKTSRPTVTCTTFRLFRNNLKRQDIGQRELSSFLTLINEPGDLYLRICLN